MMAQGWKQSKRVTINNDINVCKRLHTRYTEKYPPNLWRVFLFFVSLHNNA